jgi:OmpA-OmpF porin, OOP family
MKRKHILIASLAALAAIPASAQYVPHWYVGIGGGQSRTSDDIVSQRESSISNGVATGSTFDDNDGAWKVFGGWQVNEIFAVEAYYADLGKTHLVTNTLSTDNLVGTFDMTRKVDGFGVDAVANWRFLPQFSLLGRVGAFASRTKGDATVSGGLIFVNDPTATSRSNTVNETVAHYGLGGQWDFQPNMSLRLEWERFQNVGKAFETGRSGVSGEADTDLVALSVLMRF